jgi:hypothetical protein
MIYILTVHTFLIQFNYRKHVALKERHLIPPLRMWKVERRTRELKCLTKTESKLGRGNFMQRRLRDWNLHWVFWMHTSNVRACVCFFVRQLLHSYLCMYVCKCLIYMYVFGDMSYFFNNVVTILSAKGTKRIVDECPNTTGSYKQAYIMRMTWANLYADEYVPHCGRRGHKPYSASKFWAARVKYRPHYKRSRKVCFWVEDWGWG